MAINHPYTSGEGLEACWTAARVLGHGFLRDLYALASSNQSHGVCVRYLQTQTGWKVEAASLGESQAAVTTQQNTCVKSSQKTENKLEFPP